VTAAALASSSKGLASPITIHTRGGKLLVEFKQNPAGGYSNVFLIGPAKFVFSGQIELDG
jgi:diaminopimelate epimerase